MARRSIFALPLTWMLKSIVAMASTTLASSAWAHVAAPADAGWTVAAILGAHNPNRTISLVRCPALLAEFGPTLLTTLSTVAGKTDSGTAPKAAQMAGCDVVARRGCRRTSTLPPNHPPKRLPHAPQEHPRWPLAHVAGRGLVIDAPGTVAHTGTMLIKSSRLALYAAFACALSAPLQGCYTGGEYTVRKDDLQRSGQLAVNAIHGDSPVAIRTSSIVGTVSEDVPSVGDSVRVTTRQYNPTLSTGAVLGFVGLGMAALGGLLVLVGDAQDRNVSSSGTNTLFVAGFLLAIGIPVGVSGGITSIVGAVQHPDRLTMMPMRMGDLVAVSDEQPRAPLLPAARMAKLAFGF